MYKCVCGHIIHEKIKPYKYNNNNKKTKLKLMSRSESSSKIVIKLSNNS